MKAPLRIVQYGLGPIGLEAAAAVLDKQPSGRIQLVGAVDVDPDKVGRDVAELLSRSDETGVVVSDDAAQVLADVRPDVVLHATSSFLDRVHDQIAQCVRAGAHVVSSAEELLFPYERHPELSRRLDELAREQGVVVLGTGVNPGYVMDTLALMATGPCRDVRSVRVERVVDASLRRLPLQRKVGAGLSRDDFAQRKATGTLGHVGLMESLWMVADGLGWTLEETDEELEPVLAEHEVQTPFLTVAPGEVAGIHHVARGYVAGSVVLELDLRMYVGAEDARDAVRVDGNPPVDLVIRGGLFGDTATVAALVNAVPLVVQAQPGLRTMKDLPVPRAFATR